MNAITIITLLIIGFLIGFLANSLLTANTYQEELIKAYVRGRKYERMCITKDQENSKDA